jgi:hypothetical protein
MSSQIYYFPSYPVYYYFPIYPVYSFPIVRSLQSSVTYRTSSFPLYVNNAVTNGVDFDMINVPTRTLISAPTYRMSSSTSGSYTYDPLYFHPTVYYSNGYAVNLTDDSNIIYRKTL